MTKPPPLSYETAEQLNALFPDTMEGDRMVLELCQNHEGYEHLRIKYWPHKAHRTEPRICRFGQRHRIHPSIRTALLQEYGYLAPYSLEPITPEEVTNWSDYVRQHESSVYQLMVAHGLDYMPSTVHDWGLKPALPRKVIWILRWAAHSNTIA